jgi:hypothetical protein
MAGSILLLTRIGYHETAMDGNRISGALAQMSVSKNDSDRLLGEFQQALNRCEKRGRNLLGPRSPQGSI